MALIDNLVSYWPLNEASGNALDAHGSNDLTETGGTIDTTTGILSGARVLAAADTEHFEKADNSDLSTGDITFSFFLWFNAASFPSNGALFSKWDTGGNQKEYQCFVNSTGTIATFRVSPDGSSNVDAAATTFGALSISTWYFVAGGHNATTNEVWVSVNAGTPNTTSHSGGVFDSTAAFKLGAINFNGSPSNWCDATIDEVAFFKRDIRADLASFYNSGAGLAYPFTAASGNPHYYYQQQQLVI